MLNLVVVALILASCLADQVVINNFQFLCQKQNGEFVPMGSSPNDKTEMLVNADSFGFMTWAHNMGTYSLNPEANPPGLITISQPLDFKHGRQIWVVLVLSCSLPYRNLCPAVNNICVSSGESHPKTAPIDYNKFANYFNNGGVLLLRTPQDWKIAMSKAALPMEKLTSQEFCEVPQGKNSISCSWSDTVQYTHASYEEQSNVSSDSGAAAESNSAPVVEGQEGGNAPVVEGQDGGNAPVVEGQDGGNAPVVEGQDGGNGTGKGTASSGAAATTGAFMALPLLALF
ncbi:hypothetical protein PRIPAC_89721 [Pristionchus pacificus]|uniref:Uncharacterized protein n=1 Tax=Pristionchus pacificus TaxID=54126 RepID=A0A454XID8_PRIPA|nr:hypothetical protein PRIPAC_89721 [Pristionchus pacificus]|eukprot:PDM61356.1 hypothetical protein PRIPAC_50798 [Pristionchus pacificus]